MKGYWPLAVPALRDDKLRSTFVPEDRAARTGGCRDNQGWDRDVDDGSTVAVDVLTRNLKGKAILGSEGGVEPLPCMPFLRSEPR